MVCLYIKIATLPLQHLATFSSPICRHRRRCVLLLYRRRYPPRLPPSAAPLVHCPTGFSTAAGHPKSADALAPRHAAVGPRNAGGFLPDLPRPPGLPDPHTPRIGLLPILLLRAVLPGLRGSAAAAARRAPCRRPS
jgi:hypothetical protein